jgi:hypothetical protein
MDKLPDFDLTGPAASGCRRHHGHIRRSVGPRRTVRRRRRRRLRRVWHWTSSGRDAGDSAGCGAPTPHALGGQPEPIIFPVLDESDALASHTRMGAFEKTCSRCIAHNGRPDPEFRRGRRERCRRPHVATSSAAIYVAAVGFIGPNCAKATAASRPPRWRDLAEFFGVLGHPTSGPSPARWRESSSACQRLRPSPCPSM